jgi:TDG/mug DNA glycosylase family protein
VSAKDLTRAEYAEGAQRLDRLARWLRPACVVFVGVTGYRLAVDKTAAIGWQPSPFGGVRTYVMPNTSGLNAHAKPADFTAHLAEVVRAT